jgi:hypothetical protein
MTIAEIGHSVRVHADEFKVVTFRRNYYRCRKGCGRTGTLMYLVEGIPFTSGSVGFWSQHHEVFLLVVCESCGRRWVPSTGPALRALGH